MIHIDWLYAQKPKCRTKRFQSRCFQPIRSIRCTGRREPDCLQLTTDANDELGPIIDEPIVQRLERIGWSSSEIDPELAMLATHALVELLQIKTPQVRLSGGSVCLAY